MTFFYFAKSRIIYHWNISAILFLSLSLYHVQPANGRQEPVFRLKDIRELEEEGGGEEGTNRNTVKYHSHPFYRILYSVSTIRLLVTQPLPDS